tara:strand:- start:84 stop:350 length:267 start_codon:yes stop_codon:yes gene_type:complete
MRKTKKDFVCHSIDNMNVRKTWGKGKDKETAIKECKLAVEEYCQTYGNFELMKYQLYQRVRTENDNPRSFGEQLIPIFSEQLIPIEEE